MEIKIETTDSGIKVEVVRIITIDLPTSFHYSTVREACEATGKREFDIVAKAIIERLKKEKHGNHD